MNAQNMKTNPKKFNKDGYLVDFEDKIPFWERVRAKVFSVYFLTNVVWFLFRLLLLIGISFVILYPFLSKIAGSFMAPEDFMDITVNIIPKHFTIQTYKSIFVENHYAQAFMNTALLSLLCALRQTFVCCLIGYGLAKFRFKGNKLILFLVVFTMIVPHRTIQVSLKQEAPDASNSEVSVPSPFPWFVCGLNRFCCVQLFVTPWTVAYQVPLSMGILQARILVWVAMPSSRGSSQPRNRTGVSCISGRFFTS